MSDQVGIVQDPFFSSLKSLLSIFFLFFYKYVSLGIYLSLPSCSRFQGSGHLLVKYAHWNSFPSASTYL